MHVLYNVYMIAGYPLTLQALASASRNQRRHAFRPGTTTNHRTQFMSYIAFCQHYDLQDLNPAPETIAMYATYLSQRLKSPRSVANYISGVRLLHKYAGAPAPALESFELTLTMRAIKLTLRHSPQRKLPFTPAMLSKVCAVCDSMSNPLGKTLKVAILLGYFGMLRRSNLAPRNPSKFDPTRNTCRGDVLLAPPRTGNHNKMG